VLIWYLSTMQMQLWNRARAGFGYVASVCRSIKLGSEGREARHKNLKFFPTKSGCCQ